MKKFVLLIGLCLAVLLSSFVFADIQINITAPVGNVNKCPSMYSGVYTGEDINATRCYLQDINGSNVGYYWDFVNGLWNETLIDECYRNHSGIYPDNSTYGSWVAWGGTPSLSENNVEYKIVCDGKNSTDTWEGSDEQTFIFSYPLVTINSNNLTYINGTISKSMDDMCFSLCYKNNDTCWYPSMNIWDVGYMGVCNHNYHDDNFTYAYGNDWAYQINNLIEGEEYNFRVFYQTCSNTIFGNALNFTYVLPSFINISYPIGSLIEIPSEANGTYTNSPDDITLYLRDLNGSRTGDYFNGVTWSGDKVDLDPYFNGGGWNLDFNNTLTDFEENVNYSIEVEWLDSGDNVINSNTDYFMYSINCTPNWVNGSWSEWYENGCDGYDMEWIREINGSDGCGNFETYYEWVYNESLINDTPSNWSDLGCVGNNDLLQLMTTLEHGVYGCAENYTYMDFRDVYDLSCNVYNISLYCVDGNGSLILLANSVDNNTMFDQGVFFIESHPQSSGNHLLSLIFGLVFIVFCIGFVIWILKE